MTERRLRGIRNKTPDLSTSVRAHLGVESRLNDSYEALYASYSQRLASGNLFLPPEELGLEFGIAVMLGENSKAYEDVALGTLPKDAAEKAEGEIEKMRALPPYTALVRKNEQGTSLLDAVEKRDIPIAQRYSAILGPVNRKIHTQDASGSPTPEESHTFLLDYLHSDYVVKFNKIDPNFFLQKKKAVKGGLSYSAYDRAAKFGEGVHAFRDDLKKTLFDVDAREHTAVIEAIREHFDDGSREFETTLTQFLLGDGQDFIKVYRACDELANSAVGESDVYLTFVRGLLTTLHASKVDQTIIMKAEDFRSILQGSIDPEKPVVKGQDVLAVANSIPPKAITNGLRLNWQDIEWGCFVPTTDVRAEVDPKEVRLKLYYETDGDNTVFFECTVNRASGEFDWSALPSPKLNQEIASDAMRMMRSVLANFRIDKVSDVTDLGSVKQNGNGNGHKRNGNGERSGGVPQQIIVTNGESEKEKLSPRNVTFDGPAMEVVKGVPNADRRRIFAKVDEIRKGIRLIPLEHEDEFSDDGHRQYEVKTGGKNGGKNGYRIFVKQTSKDDYVVVKVDFRRDTSRSASMRRRGR